MSKRQLDRVTFFSKEDMSAGMHLEKAEPILESFNTDGDFELNDIIELFQIKQYFDNEIYLTSWSEEDITRYKNTVDNMWSKVVQYWTQINDSNFISHFESIELGYQPAFWKLHEVLGAYKKVSKEVFNQVLGKEELWIREVLKQPKLVKYFGQEIREYLLKEDKSAELIVGQYEQVKDKPDSDLHFPKCLSSDDKEQIIIKYLGNEDANLNYVRLIEKSRDNSIKLKPRTRLMAKKLSEKLNNEILENGTGTEYGLEVGISEIQQEPVKSELDGNIQKLTYSGKYIQENGDDISLVHNFRHLFNYIDTFGNISLISKAHELGELMIFGLQSKNEYPSCQAFTNKSLRSHLQIVLYMEYLNKLGRKLEDVLSAYLNEVLINHYGLSGLRLNFPSPNTSYLEKNRLLVPELESLLKQYSLYVEEGHIDHELLQLSSASVKISDIQSLVEKKYAYGIGDEFNMLKYHFFSKQSMLHYIEPFNNKYRNLYELLIHEDVVLDDFRNYQKPVIKKYIGNEVLYVDEKGFVKIKSAPQLVTIGRIYFDEVANYRVLPESFQEEIDKMVNQGILSFGNTLFSESESKYFNYYLNKSEYTNGLDLRNKYAHGTNSDSEKTCKNDYYILLKLLILVLLKIEQDLYLNKYMN